MSRKRLQGVLIACLVLVAVNLLQNDDSRRVFAGEWQEVKRWTGWGIKNTETFYVRSRQWRVRWAFRGTEFSSFDISACREDGEAYDIVAEYDGAGPISGSNILRSGPGECYLEIDGYEGKWVVVVEDKGG